MEKRYLTSEMKVTALGFGAMELGKLNAQEAAVLLNKVLDNGINYIDTSPCYGPSEEFIGAGIANRRSEYFLASKCCCNLSGVGPGHIFDRKTIMSNIENSLKLMKTDYIDVLQLHAPQPADMPGGREDDIVKTLFDLKKAGKIRHAAITVRNGMPTEELYPAKYGFNCLTECMEWGVFDVIQTVYGGLTRTSEIAIQKAADKGIGIVARGALKKYFANYDELFEKARLKELCEKDETQNDFLLRYTLTHPGIKTAIVGTKSAEHLAENIKAAGKGRLSDEVYAEAKKRLNSVGIVPENV